ncbi:MAG: hypothetical protein HY077_08885 [Elusimicrobia bacterium]|nr:hypothetical protein [Elusimicrobiota bacterium]
MKRQTRFLRNHDGWIAAAALALILSSRPAGALTAPNWDNDKAPRVEAVADHEARGDSLKMAPAPAPAPAPKPKREKKQKVLPPAQAFEPQVVHRVSDFALTPAEIAEIGRAVPALVSDLGIKLQVIMRRAYVGGRIPEPFKGDSLRVVTWNINAAHTDNAVAAIMAVADNSPEGVQKALGRGSPVKDKAASQLAAFSQHDVFFIQEIPLPTAIELAKHLDAEVFWAPEFIEVGDNAKGRDPQAGWNYTGNAILSRVPLSDYRVLRFANQADWYEGQKAPQPLGERLEKTAAKVLFAADAGRPHQTRPGLPYGGRVALFARTAANYHDGGAAGAKIWVGNLHLEDLAGQKITGPELRRAQAQEARAFIATVDGPMLYGGDLNTMGNSPGVIEGEDIATEVPNAMHPGQPPINRQHGLAAGVGDKFFGVVDAGNLATTLTHSPGKRKKLVAEQTFALGIDIVPYAPAVHDTLNAAKKIKEKPGNVPRDMYYAGMAAADFMPFTAVGAKGFQLFWDERSRHNPTAKANADHNLFTDIKKDDTQILNPKLGFRLGMGGYPATWTAGRPMMIPGLSRGLANAVVDWLFLRDPEHQIKPAKGKVFKEMIVDTKSGNNDEKRLSDHYPLSVEVALTKQP